MGRYTTTKNTPIDIFIPDDYLDNGWAISLGDAIHESCNSGFLTNNSFSVEAGTKYKVTYTVSEYRSGTVYFTIGGARGNSFGINGTFTQEITASNGSPVAFWSDGDLKISNVVISSGESEGFTLGFDQNNLKFVSYYSYIPEFMAKFLDGLYAFENGTLWEQDASSKRNNFFGKKYPSIITFYINVNPTTVKTLFGMRQNSSKPWEVTEVEIMPRDGKSKGQRSRIKKGNFKNLQGQWFADFLRDMNDPRFSNEVEALLNGAVLQGTVAKITIEINEEDEVRLVSVDTLSSPQQYTY